MDTLKKQKLALEKTALENRISELMKDCELLKERITSSNIEKDRAYKLIVEEKEQMAEVYSLKCFRSFLIRLKIQRHFNINFFVLDYQQE